MDRRMLRAYLKRPQSRKEIVQEFCSGKVVLDVGCVQHDIENADTDTWLHKQVVEIAADTLGVDYLGDAVASLAQRGYKVVQGDVNEPLKIDRSFDVIVVGNLIEHLSNFEGLMKNLNRLLKPDGVILISTANPFYHEQYFFSAFKNDIIVNPEHTCWLDPITLDQLARRFDLETVAVRWVKEGWNLASGVIFNDENQALDIFIGRWTFNQSISFYERFITIWLKMVLDAILPIEKRIRFERQYGNDFGRFLYLSFKGRLFGLYWRFRRCFVPMSDINRFELYMSVLKKSDNSKLGGAHL